MRPIYRINLKVLKENYSEFLKFGKIYFPVKTNHNKYILKTLKKLGAGFECDSIDHIKKIYSRKNAGEIIYSNVAKTKQDIEWAIKRKINFFTVDDEETLKYIIQLAKKYKFKNLKINVRINVYDMFRKEFEAKSTQDSRLGASVNTCKKLLEIINQEKYINISKGISFYVQTEVHDKEDILIVVSKYLAEHFSKEDSIDWINIGGGSSIERLEKSKEEMFKNLSSLNVNKIILEPGRFMVDKVEDAIIPINRIIKTDLNGGEYVVSMAIGLYHGLFDYKLHNRKFNFFIKTDKEETLLELYDGIGEKMVLRGPTADSSDLLGIYKMPNCEIDENTAILVKNVGAYVEVFHSDFSGKVPLEYEIVEE